jgi:hypothetical protein
MNINKSLLQPAVFWYSTFVDKLNELYVFSDKVHILSIFYQSLTNWKNKTIYFQSHHIHYNLPPFSFTIISY